MRTHYDTLGPRVGFAWSQRGHQKTVLRGGYGIFYFGGNNNHESLSANPPFSRSVNISNTSLSNPAAGRGANFPPNVASFDTNYLIPTVQHWSLNLQRKIARETVLSIAYVGTRGNHLEQTVNINQPRPNADVPRRINVNAIRPYLGYGNTHVFVVNYIYQLPFFRSDGVASKLLGGWQVSGITTFQSGLPFTVTQSGDRAGVGGGTQRPDLLQTPTRLGRIDRFFDTSAFAQTPFGRFGTVGRNILRGPGINDWSMSFFKNTRINRRTTEGISVQFGAEFFNLFNHPQFEGVGVALGSDRFGRVTTARDPRIVQFRLKLSY